MVVEVGLRYSQGKEKIANGKEICTEESAEDEREKVRPEKEVVRPRAAFAHIRVKGCGAVGIVGSCFCGIKEMTYA